MRDTTRFLRLTAALVTVLAGGALVSRMNFVHAQGSPPSIFYGSLTVDGAPAATNTPVIAEINGKDCGGSYQPATPLTAGRYAVKALGATDIQGCGTEGSIVLFRLGSRYAAQTGAFSSGAFINVDLTVSGPGTRPSVATPSPSPTDSPAPTPSPTPTPAPTPTPTPAGPQPYSVSMLDLGSPCIPASGAAVCDDQRQALWNGDPATWTAADRAQGQTLTDPTLDEVFAQTIAFRHGAGDPATIGAIAQGLGWPHVRITGARYRGVTDGEGDEWVEVKNLGGGAQDMTSWSVRVGDSNARWMFQDGFTLQPGQSCRFYTGAARPDSCPGSSAISPTAVLPNDAGTISLWVDSLNLRAIEVRYAADPNAQPAPPNLQGLQ